MLIEGEGEVDIHKITGKDLSNSLSFLKRRRHHPMPEPDFLSKGRAYYMSYKEKEPADKHQLYNPNMPATQVPKSLEYSWSKKPLDGIFTKDMNDRVESVLQDMLADN